MSFLISRVVRVAVFLFHLAKQGKCRRRPRARSVKEQKIGGRTPVSVSFEPIERNTRDAGG